jgi:hypothetical protein
VHRRAAGATIVINGASIRRDSGDGAIFGSHAVVSFLRPSRMAADVVFSAMGLAAVIAIWRRLKTGICDPYRPELHYMRGPGPKWHEKRAQDHQAVPSAR